MLLFRYTQSQYDFLIDKAKEMGLREDKMIIARAEAVNRIGDAEHHGQPRENVGIDRKHAESLNSHVVEVFIIQRHQIHGHADNNTEGHNAGADQCTQALSAIAANDGISHGGFLLMIRFQAIC